MSKQEQTLIIIFAIAWLAFTTYTLQQVSETKVLVKQILINKAIEERMQNSNKEEYL